MTKTCPDCQAEVLSTSQPDAIEAFNALLLIEHGLDEPMATRTAEQWNRKCAELAEARAALAATPAVGIEKAVEILRRRAAGYEDRATAIFSGRIMADELRANAREIEALADAATPSDLNQEAADQPEFDNPRDPFASPDRLPPAVGGEREALQAALAFIDTALVADKNPTISKRAVVRIIREALAAQPASPFRGREIEEALKPFATAWEAYGDKPSDDTHLSNNRDESWLEGTLITFGDLRRANLVFTALSASSPEQSAAAPADIRWGVNVLLEKIAEKFESWDTLDLFRSEAAATVRGFKHDLTAKETQA